MSKKSRKIFSHKFIKIDDVHFDLFIVKFILSAHELLCGICDGNFANETTTAANNN